ncbi:GD11126 [Drosophila simulans]|uniref:GD11126 n=1 Tax=Drosophila simulans TaxID=7240 RepID=B4NVW1_DROSI|nr:GD11126 [Drosophila simulans]
MVVGMDIIVVVIMIVIVIMVVMVIMTVIVVTSSVQVGYVCQSADGKACQSHKDQHGFL